MEYMQTSRGAWAQPDRGTPLYIRRTPEGYEGIRICEPEPGTFGVAHGVVRFSADACDAYLRAVTEAAFQKEEYWKTCLLPERYSSYDGAADKMLVLMGEKDGA